MAEIKILQWIESRRSRVAFDPTHSLRSTDLTAMLEAAQWAPSGSNLQPWRWAIGHRGDATHGKLLALLAPANQAWAQHASALILVVAEVKRLNQAGELVPARTAMFDVGMAAMNIALEATHRELNVRMMGGFDVAAARQLLPEVLEPICVMALGKANDGSHLPSDVAARDLRPRARKPIEESIITI